MSTYLEGALVKDEALVHVGHISLWSLWHLIAGGIVLPLPGISEPLAFRKAFIEAQDRAKGAA